MSSLTDMIKKPSEWSAPMLPIKRYKKDGGMHDLGVLMYHDTRGLILLRGNMWSVGYKELSEAIEVTPEKVEEDGWEVD